MGTAKSNPIQIGRGRIPTKYDGHAYIGLADVNLQVTTVTRRLWTPTELYALLAEFGCEIVQRRGRHNLDYKADALQLEECHSFIDMLLAHQCDKQGGTQ